MTPKPHSSGGKEWLGKISKMGNRCIRRLLYLGAMGVIAARRRKAAGDDWLWQMLARKPVKLVAIALANRTARTVRALLKSAPFRWALIRSGETDQAMRARTMSTGWPANRHPRGQIRANPLRRTAKALPRWQTARRQRLLSVERPDSLSRYQRQCCHSSTSPLDHCFRTDGEQGLDLCLSCRL